MIVRLDTNPKIYVVPDVPTVHYTGYTPTVLISSGATVVTNISGNTWIVYSNPTGATVNWGDIQGDITNQTDLINYISGATSGLTSSWSGLTGQPSDNQDLVDYVDIQISAATSGLTSSWSGLTGQPTDNADLMTLLSGYTQTGTTADLRLDFNSHSGNTLIHQTSGDTVGLINDALLPYWDSGETSSYVQSQISGFTQDIQYLSGVTSGLTQDIQYLSGVTSGMTADITFLGDFTGDTLQQYTDLKEPSGFVDPSAIVCTYSYSARTITLSGNLDYYWHGVKKTLASPWTSTPHAASVNNWYLSTTDGTNFTWSNSIWNFYDMQVSYGRYEATSGATFFGREVHGAMDWRVHQELHYKLGAYHVSGMQAIAGTYTGGTATDSANSPSFAQGVIQDEDCPTTIPQWLKSAGYTIMRVSGATSIFTMANTVPFLAAGANQYIYVNNPLTGALTNGINSRFYNVYTILLPVTADAGSQKYRMICLLPQQTYTTLSAAQAESTQGLQLGSLSTSAPELVIYGRITYETSVSNSNYGRCSIAGITYVLNNVGSAVNIGGTSASNHANLSNLLWDDSGHISAGDYLAAFNSGGVAVAIPKATFSASGHTHPYLPLTGGTVTGAVTFNSAPVINGSSGSTKYTLYRNSNTGFYQWRQGVHSDGTWVLTNYNSSGVANYTNMQAYLDGTVNFQYGIKLAGTAITKSAAWLNATITGVTGYYPSSGGTLTGNVLVVTSGANLRLIGTTGTTKYLSFEDRVSGINYPKFQLIADSSDSATLYLRTNDDAGTLIGYPFTVTRSTGVINFSKDIQVSGSTLASTYALKSSITQKTGTTYTIAAADEGKILEFTTTGSCTISLPTGLTTNFQVTLVSYGNGTTSGVKTIAAGTGATVKSANSALKLSTIFGAATAYYRGSNVWVCFGDLTA